MADNNNTPPPNVWEPIGLPATFTPGPVMWYFAKMLIQTPAGPRALHVLIFDTSAGKVAVALTPDDLKRFVSQAHEQVSGLTIAGDDTPMPPWPMGSA